MNRYASPFVLTVGLSGVVAYLLLEEFSTTTVRNDVFAPGVTGTTYPVMAASSERDRRSDTSSLPIIGYITTKYLEVGEITSTSELESRIRAVVISSGALRSDLELEALLLRFVDLSPSEAVKFALQLPVSLALVESMFEAWLAIDPESAISELRQMDARIARAIALSVADAGGDERVSELLAALFDVNSKTFRSELLIRRAERSPMDTLTEAVLLPDQWLRYETSLRVARKWALVEPAIALAHLQDVAGLDSSLRNSLRFAVVDEWSLVDPDAATEFLFSSDGQKLFDAQLTALGSIVGRLAIRRPHELLALADDLPNVHRTYVKRTAYEAIADANLSEAMRLVSEMADSLDKGQFLEAISSSFARQNPAGAVDWALNLVDAPPLIEDRIFGQIARSDLGMAIDLAIENADRTKPIDRWLGPQVTLLGMDEAEIAQVADRLTASGRSEARSIEHLLTSWSRTDPSAAIDWLLSRSKLADIQQLKAAARGIANGNVAFAVQAIDLMPQNLRGAWITEIAGPYAQSDPAAAVRWLESFRQEPLYDLWISEAAEHSVSSFSSHDPRRTAMMLATAERPDASVTSALAARWAAREPHAAAEWSLELRDSNARTAAVTSAVSNWMSSDRPAAETWALSLGDRNVRDAALRAILLESFQTSTPVSSRILTAFSNDTVRSRAYEDAIPLFRRLAREDLSRARELLDTHISSSVLSERIEAEIALVIRASEE